MGWRLRLRTCYIGHLKYPSMGRKGVKKKEKEKKENKKHKA